MVIIGAVVFTYSYHPRFGCMGPNGKAALRSVTRRDVHVAWIWAMAIDLFFGFFAAFLLYLYLAENGFVPRLNQLIPVL